MLSQHGRLTQRHDSRCPEESGRNATPRAVASGRGLQAGHRSRRSRRPGTSWGQIFRASIHATLETWRSALRGTLWL